MLLVSALCCMRGEREVFRDVTFSLAQGQWIHVRGENGAGKTTLLKALTGLLRPEQGTVTWNGQAIETVREDYHHDLFYLGHANGMKDDLDAAENLRAACAIAGTTKVPDIAAALRSLGLNPQNKTPVRSLSQGQKRRVALARLALAEAKLWILDEPFAALDAGAVTTVVNLMDRHLDQGGALVLTSHQATPLTRGGTDVWIAPNGAAS
jgi:heme exporter protein A